MKPEEVLASIEAAARSRGWPIIGPKRGEILDEVIEEHKPARVLEVGTNVGYSAIRMARHLIRGQKLTCIEINEDLAKVARLNIEKAGLSDRAEVVVGDALQILPSLDGSFDMVFLDAVKEDYLTYLKSAEHLLHKGSVVVADNAKSHAKEMKHYLDYVRYHGGYSSVHRETPPNWGTDAGDAVEISIKL
jgi:predicted O-methyltransferase YrrM